MLHALLVCVVLVAITATFGKTVYHAEVASGATLARFSVMLLIGGAAFCALGFAITAVIPNAAAVPTVFVTILPLLFLSEIFIPIGDNAPVWIHWTAASFRSSTSSTGSKPASSAQHSTGATCSSSPCGDSPALLLASKYFGWQPRT